MDIKVLSGIDNIVRGYKNIALSACALAALAITLAMFFGFKSYQDSSARIYVVKDYGTEQVIDKRAQIKAHSEMFYHLFFEYDPSNFTQRIDKALYLIGNDGKTLRDMYSSSGWYQKMQQNNIRFAAEVDSMRINDRIYPYEVTVYGRQAIMTDMGTKFNYIWSKFTVVNVNNNDNNPFGLQIDHFNIFNNQPYVAKK